MVDRASIQNLIDQHLTNAEKSGTQPTALVVGRSEGEALGIEGRLGRVFDLPVFMIDAPALVRVLSKRAY